MDPTTAMSIKMFDLHELEELELDAYENALIYTEITKRWHDKCISKRKFNKGELRCCLTLS